VLAFSTWVLYYTCTVYTSYAKWYEHAGMLNHRAWVKISFTLFNLHNTVQQYSSCYICVAIWSLDLVVEDFDPEKNHKLGLGSATQSKSQKFPLGKIFYDGIDLLC